jgi:hypothetical protein
MATYVPGVCNIGPAEIRRRMRGGVAGGVVALGGLATAVGLGLPRPVRLLVALPAAGSAVGFLQAGSRFCVALGSQGLFNFSDDLRRRESVVDAEARRVDRRKALRLLGSSAVIGAAVALAGLLLPAGPLAGRR